MKLRFLFVCSVFIPLILTGQGVNFDPVVDFEYLCDPGLKIHEFYQKNSGAAPSYNYKIVVGRPFDYKAKPKDGTDWNWELGLGTGADFQPFWNVVSHPSGTDFSYKSSNMQKAIIPNEFLPLFNSTFGDNTGAIRASNSLGSSTETAPENSLVQVFYEKDATTNNENVPNWFYYWQQAPVVTSLLKVPGVPQYNTKTCSFDPAVDIILSLEYGNLLYNPPPGVNTYGSMKWSVKSDVVRDKELFGCSENAGEEVMIMYEPYFHKIEINEACGFQSMALDGTILHGAHCFYSTVVHEVEHAIIHGEVWNFVWPAANVYAGYNSIWDMDGDGYKDVWESYDIAAQMAGFDPLNSNDKYVPYPNGDWQNSSIGTVFEEERCRNKELSTNKTVIDQYDWSFDHTNMHQGKQWK